MYALLDSQDQLVNGKPVRTFPIAVAFESEGKHYPRQWFTASTEDEKRAAHVWPLVFAELPAGHEHSGADPSYSFDGSVVTETPASVAIPVEEIQANNKMDAEFVQSEILIVLQDHKTRMDFGLPGSLADNQVEHLKDQLQTLQHAIDNPPTDPNWQPHEAEHYPPWNSETHYQVGDVVSHNGSIWKATSNNTRNEPDDVPGDWEKVS